MSTTSYGTAGASLSRGWAGQRVTNANALRLAVTAERTTAQALNRACTRVGAAALHDLDIPIALADGGRPNIDHAVVTGDTGWLIDSKAWKPGFCWTLPGFGSFRGLSRFEAAEKQTMSMARDAVGTHLARNAVQGIQVRCLVVAHPTSQHGHLSTWALMMPGAKTITADALAAWAAREITTGPNPGAVRVLAPLVRMQAYPRR